MMGMLREWLTSLVVVTLLLSVAQTLIPEGSLRRIASFTGGLILLAALLQPVMKLDLTALQPDLELYEETLRQRQTELETAGEDALEELIAARTAAYISDKATTLGLTVTARVETAPDADGTPVPAAAELEGEPSQELAEWMERELGIPQERQVWHGAEGKN